MDYNYTAFHSRFTKAIETNLHTYKRNEVIKLACELLRRFPAYLQQQSIRDWGGLFKLSVQKLNDYLSGEPSTIKRITNKNEMLRDFLSEFSIQQNAITGEFSITRDGKKYTLEELEWLCEESHIPTKNLHKVLNVENQNITVTNVYNPLKDMFQELADNYNGEKVIETFCTYLKAHDFGDKTDCDYYDNYLKTYVKKWLCIAAGMALGITTNDVMLLWIDPRGGTGKSYLNRWLFSIFEAYYLRIGENESFIDMKGISKSKFVVDYDELPFSKKRYLSYKSNIAAQDGQEYSKRNKQYNRYTRICNYVGSTNKANRLNQPGFLLDDDAAMRRRILPIELSGKINYALETNGYMTIDLKQLWGQAAQTIMQAKKDGDTTFCTWESDHDLLRSMNMRYIDNTTLGIEHEILRRYRRATQGDGILMQASQMIDLLKVEGRKVDMNEWQLGIFLKDNQYKRGRKGMTRGWWVSEN